MTCLFYYDLINWETIIIFIIIQIRIIFQFSQEKSLWNGDPCILKPDKSCNGEGNVTPLQYSCLENPMDGGAW